MDVYRTDAGSDAGEVLVVVVGRWQVLVGRWHSWLQLVEPPR